MPYLLALDQGTSSSRAIVFALDGRVCSMAQQPFRQIYPQPGWVEHDPREIWASQWAVVGEAIRRAGLQARDIAAIGITNQRETTVLWDRASGAPIGNAIVWQDRRTEPLCSALRERGLEASVAAKTGLRLDPYFSATKIRWLLDNIPGARERAQAGELAFGTIDTWLIWQLTQGARHVTDVSNASRTLLFNIHDNRWDPELLATFDIPPSILPEVLPSSADFGRVAESLMAGGLRITGVAGDQQAALFGQGCTAAGEVKNTYGTGCFMLMHTGEAPIESRHGLITTRAAARGPTRDYALEGSVFIGGAVVQWLRDELRAFEHSADVEALAASVPDTGGVVFVPAFAGLGAPSWPPDARGSISGLTRGSGVAHIARAALESIALQSAALLEAMQRDTAAHAGGGVSALRVDGGACANDLLMQMQADVIGIPVLRPATLETTALGAALLAGIGAGLFQDPGQMQQALAIERVFEPQKSPDWAKEKRAAWEKAVARCRD